MSNENVCCVIWRIEFDRSGGGYDIKRVMDRESGNTLSAMRSKTRKGYLELWLEGDSAGTRTIRLNRAQARFMAMALNSFADNGSVVGRAGE